MYIFLNGHRTHAYLSSEFTIGDNLSDLECEELKQTDNNRSFPDPFDLEDVLREDLTRESRELHTCDLSRMSIW